MNTSKYIQRGRHSPRNFSRREKVDALSPLQITKRAFISVAFTVTGAFILILISSALILSTPDPALYIPPISVSLLCISAIACGFISSYRTDVSPLTAGLLSGTILCVFVLTVALFLGHRNMVLSPTVRVILFLAIVPLSVCGAFIGGTRLHQKRRTTIKRR